MHFVSRHRSEQQELNDTRHGTSKKFLCQEMIDNLEYHYILLYFTKLTRFLRCFYTTQVSL